MLRIKGLVFVTAMVLALWLGGGRRSRKLLLIDRTVLR